MIKPLLLSLTCICLYGSTFAIGGDTLKKNNDTAKKEKFFVGVNMGFGVPLGYFKVARYGKVNRIGLARIGIKYSLITGVAITQHFSAGLEMDYAFNPLNTQLAGSDSMLNSLKAVTNTTVSPGDSVNPSYRYSNGNQYWHFYNLMGGVYYIYKYPRVNINLRVMAGITYGTSPAFFCNYKSDWVGEYGVNTTTIEYYAAPSHAYGLCTDAGIVLNYLVNKHVSMLFNMDLENSFLLKFNAAYSEYYLFNDTEYWPPSTRIISKVYSGTYSYTTPVTLLSLGMGICYSLFK